MAATHHILVLGARVRDGVPTLTLTRRLRRALELDAGLRAQGADPIVVVSGAGESGPMRSWLMEHGMDASRIVEEPEATSTNENLEKAHALFPDTSRWLVVTSDFHAPRTRLWAWHLGIPVRVITARTPWLERIQHGTREAIATAHSALRVLWRRWRA